MQRPPARRFQFRLITFLVLVALIAAFLALFPHTRAWWTVHQLSNSQLQFSGSHWGDFIFIEGEIAEAVRDGEPDRNLDFWLVNALSDPSRFAAAHYLLTFRHRERIEAASAFWNNEWESTFIPLAAYTHPDRMPALASFWKKLLFKPAIFTEQDRILHFPSDRVISVQAGDLIPCPGEESEFELVIKSEDSDFPLTRTFHFRRIGEPELTEGNEWVFPPETDRFEIPGMGTLSGQVQLVATNNEGFILQFEWASEKAPPEKAPPDEAPSDFVYLRGVLECPRANSREYNGWVTAYSPFFHRRFKWNLAPPPQ